MKRVYCILSIVFVITSLVIFLISYNIIKIQCCNREEGYDELLQMAEEFHQIFTNGNQNKALKLTDDFDKERNEYKALFENKNYYIILYYDENKIFQGGKFVDKVLNTGEQIVVSAIIAILLGGVITIILRVFFNIKDIDKN